MKDRLERKDREKEENDLGKKMTGVNVSESEKFRKRIYFTAAAVAQRELPLKPGQRVQMAPCAAVSRPAWRTNTNCTGERS